MKRVATVDLSKIITMLGVVALHTQRCSITHDLYNPILYYMARFCMPMFFMVNGYLILAKIDFDRQYYKKKILNIIRVIVLWSIFGFFYSWILMEDGIFVAFKNLIKGLIGHYIIPTWYLFTFAVIYTILLIGFKFIKKNIIIFTLILGLLCSALAGISLFQINKGGYFIQAIVPQRWRLWTWMFYFMLGYVMKIFSERFILDNKLLMCVGGGCAIFTGFVVVYQYKICFVKSGNMNSEFMYDDPIIIIWCMLLFCFIINLHLSEKISIFVEKISTNMFGVFAVHEWINNLFKLTLLPKEYKYSWMASFVLWVGLFLTSYFVTKLVIRFGGKTGKKYMIY